MDEHLGPGRGTDVAGRHGDGPQAEFVGRVRAVGRELHERHRVVVGEGDAGGPQLLGGRGDGPGEASSERVSASLDLEMSQFWQKRQARLQPAVPNESTAEPGRKWWSGFFSIGSTQKPLERP